jgi:ubiquinone/menaquinone biosynthesis C-methylase UbiE
MVDRGTQRDVVHFDRWAEKYEHSSLQRFIGRVHDAMLEMVAAEGPSPARVLDVGCGTGRLLRKVGERWPGAQLIGIDPAEGMIAAARQLAPEITFTVAPAESIPVQAGSIDVAFSALSQHHWADQLQGLREVARTLGPGGILCLADLTMPRWISRLLRSRVRSPAAIRRLMAQAGFEIDRQRRMLARVILIVTGRRARTAVEPRNDLGSQ